MLKNEKILNFLVKKILEDLLTNKNYYGKIILKLDVVDSKITKRVEINNQNIIVE